MALLLQYAPSLAARVEFPRRVGQGGSGLANVYSSVASRFGLTLDSNLDNVVISTQWLAGCISPCPAEATKNLDAQGITRHCGSCALLNVGDATFAVVPAYAFEEDGTGKAQYDIQSQRRVGEALTKVLQYSRLDQDPMASLPWCGLGKSQRLGVSGDALWGVAGGQYLSVLMQNVSSRSKPFLANDVVVNTTIHSVHTQVFESSRATLQSIVNAGIVQNCSFWDSLGIGFVAGPNKRTTKRQPASVANNSFVTVWPLELEGKHNTSTLLVTPGFGGGRVFVDKQFQLNIRTITADAARLLDQQVAQDIATTDGTKTWLGALWDMSVVILGIVAMACGRADTEGWISRQLDRFWDCCGPQAALGRRDQRCFVVVCVAKVLFCCVVVLALVMAPAVVMAAEVAAHQQNTSGDSSKVGLLAIDGRGCDC
jgi:hypothetical protein